MRLHVLLRGLSSRGPAAAVLALVLVTTTLAGSASAQGTPFYPYFNKNNIHYDDFEWSIYETDHFEIYYYTEIEQHLERIAGYAEGAYQQVSSNLKHDLPNKVSLILFKTHSEFEQQNVIPGAAQEGVGAFAEPFRDRMLLPIDDPPDRLYGLIVHELTHQFQFDIIPTGLIRQSVPLWVNEGQADYERGPWTPIDLMTVRDAAVADVVPKMSRLEGYGDSGNPRLIYNLGHAVFEFIEARWGKEGIRNFMFALRKSIIGGGEDAYEEAFQLSPDAFDQEFDRYLKERFKPFRDKERPADYGADLSPNAERTRYTQALSIAPSPSGDLLAIVTLNRKDREIDIVLASSKDGSIVRNLTEGFNKDMGFNNIVQLGERFNTMHWMSWASKGDRLAYFVRTEKERTLIVQNVTTGAVEARVAMDSVDEPESPSFSPDGRMVAFSALRGGVGDIFTVDLETQGGRQPHRRRVQRLRADVCARRPEHHLRRAHQRQHEALPLRRRHEAEDANHLRDARRRLGPVRRRADDRVLVDGDRSGAPGRARGGAQRQRLQPVDARPGQRRAQAVHRRARRQPLCGRAPRGFDVPHRLRHLLQGGLRDPHDRAP